MKIGFFKLGRSILFDKKSWSAIGGDIDAPTLLTSLAKQNPKDEFWIIGGNDIHKLKSRDHIPSNIKAVQRAWTKDDWKLLKDQLEKLDLDFIICYLGPHSTCVNLAGQVYRTGTTVLQMSFLKIFQYYSGPIIHSLNQIKKVPILGLCPDNRFRPRAKDWTFHNRPKMYLAQDNFINKERWYHNLPTRDESLQEVEYRYSGLETVFLIGKEKKKRSVKGRDRFTVILNQGIGTNGIDRWPILNEYVIQNKIKCSVYGKWEPLLERKHKNVFKGKMWLENLEDELLKTKYTICIPILKHTATAKFWEMAYYGILPFIHPFYDTQCNILPKDHFLRLKDAADLKNKIKQLENDPKLYKKIFNELQSMLKDEYFDGSFLNKKIYDAYKELKKCI